MTTLRRNPFTYARYALAGLWLIAALPLTMLAAGGLGLLFGFEPRIEEAPFPLVLAAVHLLTGALWARALLRAPDWRLPALAAGAAFAGAVVGLAAAINHAEQVLDRLLVTTGQPVHVLFGLIFVPSTALVAGSTGLALGLGLRSGRSAVRLALAGGLAGGAAFLAVACLMDLAGFRVGAPGAEQRATMITVTMLGIWTAAIAGSAAIGRFLPPPAGMPSPAPLRHVVQ